MYGHKFVQRQFLNPAACRSVRTSSTLLVPFDQTLARSWSQGRLAKCVVSVFTRREKEEAEEPCRARAYIPNATLRLHIARMRFSTLLSSGSDSDSRKNNGNQRDMLNNETSLSSSNYSPLSTPNHYSLGQKPQTLPSFLSFLTSLSIAEDI